MWTPIKTTEVLADTFIFLFVFYPLAALGGLAQVCNFGECGVIIDMIMKPAAFLGFMMLFGAGIILIPAVLVAVYVSIGTKMRRYSQNNVPLYKLLYSVPMITLLLLAAAGISNLLS